MDRNRWKKVKTLIIASNNSHKINEIKAILSEFNIKILSLKEAGIDIDVEETGVTFMENAYIKASEIHKLKSDSMILADDSGLTVDILGGAPGVYSARFAGEHGDDRKNNEKLLSMLQGTPKEKRTAKFVCAMALITEDNKVIKVQGEVDGYVQEELSGAAGFGYDPLFYVPGYNMTFAEMSEEQKNIISHRAKALSKLKNEISSVI